MEPGKHYRFRVTPFDPSTGLHLSPPSGWSNVVDMEHISSVEPPQIKVIQPMVGFLYELMIMNFSPFSVVFIEYMVCF